MTGDGAPEGLATIVLAAGEGSRYGGAKQLAEIDGKPMLRRVLDAAEGFGAPQVVVLGARAEIVRAAVPPRGWKVAIAADWAAGPGASLRAGLRVASEANAALIVLGDLAWLRSEAVQAIVDAAGRCDREIVRAFDAGGPGHPLLVRGDALRLARNAPDAGLGSVLRGCEVEHVACESLGVSRDVDTREDLPRSGRAQSTVGARSPSAGPTTPRTSRG